MAKQNLIFKERNNNQNHRNLPILIQGVLILVNIFVVITAFFSPLYWLSILRDFQDFIRSLSYRFFKQKIISSQSFNLKVKSFIEVFLIFALGFYTWGLYTSFINIPADFKFQWQIFLAIGLLNFGIKIFVGINMNKEVFNTVLVRQNLLWMLISVVALGGLLVPNLDYYISFLVAMILLIQSIQRFNYNINNFQPPVKTIEVPVNVEVQKEQVQNLDKPLIELFDISDEVIDRLKKIEKVKYVHNTLVCKIKKNQEIVNVTLVVDNQCTQEELFDIKKKAKKLFKKLEFMRSVVEIEYEAEYKGLI